MREAWFASVLVCAVSVSAEVTPPAEQASGPRVEQAVVCTGVVDRTPHGAGDTFDADVGRLYCFTKLIGIQNETTISHVWYRGEQKVHAQPLAVRAPAWRTWSNKGIPSNGQGAWHVDVVTAEGTVLTTAAFTIR
ncbi:MAG: DUF2914 domain-containing protein [Candidatus Eisenbacteria bacterium]|jgi:hypothetical protein|nr:DUF2914 domain-containing protein [Candidatus Eisenbacteria bacterium]